MARSVWKGPNQASCFLRKKYQTIYSEKKKQKRINMYARSSAVAPDYVGKKVHIHSGHTLVPILITELMVGHKFGEFCFTRKKTNHAKKTKTNKAKKK